MPINPAIALSVKPLEIQQRDPLQEYAQIMSIQNAQIQNQLARQQMEQEQGVVNYLRGPGNLTTPEGRAGLRQFGKTGLAYEKLLADQEMNALKRQELEGKLRDQRMTALGTGLTSVLVDPSDANLTAAFDRLDATGVDTKPFRQQFANMPDLAQRKAAITQYVTSNPEGRQALAFVQPKPEKADLYGQTVWIDTNPNSPTYLKPVQTLEDRPLPPAVAAQKKDINRAGATTIDMRQESEFEKALGAGQAKRVLDSKATAEDAAQILRTNQVGRDILKSGAITGTGADFFVGFNNALKQAGIDFGYADAAANSQAYAAAMGANVGKIIKQFGAGTGLSDDDRKFAEQMAGGRISLTDTALRRILDINDRAANNVIDKHNKDVRGIKTNVPLTVEKPVFEQAKPSAANQIPGQTLTPAVAIPQAAIDALKAGRGTDAQFDEIFGPGAAKRARGGK